MSDFSVYNNIGKTFPQPDGGANPASGKSGGAFGNVLKDAIQQVNELEKGAQTDLQKFLNQESDLHSVMISLEKADLSFQVMMQVRNKIVQAYQEIMRTQV
jgi:flagellar hook-basal body complex protein FliE